MDENKVIVDTNIFFAVLVRTETVLRRRLIEGRTHTFYCPHFLIVELFKHKERIARASRLAEPDLLECLHEVISRVHFVEEGVIPIGTWIEARRLCQDIDPKDSPFVALTLHLEGRLWTRDDGLKNGLRTKGFNAFYDLVVRSSD